MGTAASIVSARSVAMADSGRSRAAFSANATNIASTLQLDIQHEQDLTFSAGAFLIANPNGTEAQFLQWSASLHAFARYPELASVSELVLVPASELGAYAAHQEADPSGPLSAHGTFQVSPAGNRPFYCLVPMSQERPGTLILPDGLDLCQSSLGPALLKARASGLDEYLPYYLGKTQQLAVGSAVYRGGLVPSTVTAREDAFVGWTGTEINPGVLLSGALQGYPHTAVAFDFGSGTSKVGFKAGSAPLGGHFATIGLSNGWHVTVFGAVIGSGIFSHGDALTLLLGGIALSWLLALLVCVLGTSRSRALVLVDERTDELRYQAFHDSLTGLPNRALILDRISQMMARARREHTTVAALFLDLDNFKDINDTLGHRSGDQLLTAVGVRLAGVLREGDTIGRLGGDEFVMLTEGSLPARSAEAVAERILAAFEPPFLISGSDIPLTVTVSVGIATGDRETPEELLRDADIALYRAKGAGKNRAEVFTRSMLEYVDDHRTLDVDLHTALSANQFFLVYQPTFSLATGAFTGVEALLRWRHPTRGVVQPDNFIPALEASGLIVPVGRWVLQEACQQGAKWHSEGHQFSVSVNVAAKQLQRDRIIDDVYGALSGSGFTAEKLVLELTESALMHDVAITVTRLELLKAIGVRLAIDDFGTGFSSLAQLKRFPIDILKIDRSFISDAAETYKSAAIVQTFVQLGKALGLEIVAEGIETDDQRVRLASANVDTGQGFLFARPLGVEGVDRMLAEPDFQSRMAKSAV